MQSWLARAAREWPWGIAVAAILSLFFIPRFVHFGVSVPEGQRQEIDALRREVETGDAAAAESRLASFLVRNPRSPLRIEASLLLARATIARGRAGLYPGAESLTRAWSILLKAPKTPEYAALRRETAALFSEYDLPREAVERLSLLYGETRDPDLALDMARALTKRAGLEPELRNALLDEASTRISDALRVASPERRIDALRAQAGVFREARRDEDLIPLLASELAESRNPAHRGLLQLERGRTFARLGRNMEAMTCFDEAERLIPDPLLRGMAQVHQAELFIRAENAEGLEVCKRLQSGESPAAPFAQVVLGAALLKSKPAVGFETMRSGYAQIRRPRQVEDAGFDPAWALSALRSAVERETDPDRLQAAAGVYGEIVRLRPLSMRLGFEHGALLLRSRRYEEAADRFLATALSERADAEAKERGTLAAADACGEGGLHLRAANLYREYADLRPASNTAGLFHRASSLRKAGDAAAALQGFEDYVSKAGPSGSFSGPALLEKAGLFAAASDWAAALATYERVLKARDVATSPEKDDWALALLGRGRVLLQLSRPADARKSLEEYLERYAEGSVPTPASIEAAWLLVRADMDERRWKEGLEHLRAMESLAARLPESDRAPYREHLDEARFVEGDLRLGLGDYAAAYRAFEDAARRNPSSESRLRSLIGRARASARLERLEEARRDYTTAKAVFDEGLGGPAREYWEVALQALAKEVR